MWTLFGTPTNYIYFIVLESLEGLFSLEGFGWKMHQIDNVKHSTETFSCKR